MNNIAERLVLIRIAKLIQKKGFVTGSDGNISIRVDGGFIITPSGVNKSFLRAQDLLYINDNGKIITKDTWDIEQKPSSEWPMHIKIYQERKDINAIIHTHPLHTVLFSVLKEKENIKKNLEDFLPETKLTVGHIPISEQKSIPSDGVFNAKLVSLELDNNNAFILKGHGLITAAKIPCIAYNYLEKIEHTAKFAIEYLKLSI